jgi:peptidoglycan/LPS O-acetylase OafA/YrhL
MVDRIVSSAWKPLLPAIPCALILYFDPRVVLGFYQGYIPALTKLAYYCIYFFVGTALNRHSESVHNHGRHGIKYLAVAGILFAVMLPQIHECVTQGMTDSRLAVLCGMMALFGATTTFGLFALFLGTIQRGNAITRYLAEASFWVYLVHLPFVGLTHIALAQTSMPTIAKFCIAGITALGLSLASYQVFVRRTSLGAFLNGTRPKSAAATETSQPAITPTPLKVSA